MNALTPIQLTDQPDVHDSNALREWLRQLAILTRRNLVHIRRQPEQLSGATIQPVMFTLLFVYVIGSAVPIPGGGTYTNFALAGLILLNLSTASTASAVGLSSDITTGVITRFRTLPMSPTAILVSRTASDLLNSLLCTMVVIGTGLIVGWRSSAPVGGIVAGFGIIVVFNYALSWIGVCLGMVVRSAEAAAAFGLIIFLPLSFLSNALVPTDGMPKALRTFAEWNPLSAVTTAARTMLHNPNPAATSNAWPLQHPVTASLIWTATILSLSVPLARRLYRRRVLA